MYNPRFVFRPLTEADLPLLYEWLNRLHLLEWWGGETSVTDVREKYLPRIAGSAAARPFVACLDDQPVGYIQYYLAAEGSAEWWPDEPGPGVLGIDQFLADNERLNQGLGTALVSQFAAFLFEGPDVTEIRVDPHPDNARAIRCYTKVGFREVGPITTPDGPALMMVMDRQSFGSGEWLEDRWTRSMRR
ncbi:GNAT family N-acetyltransferase [soil metagenome]